MTEKEDGLKVLWTLRPLRFVLVSVKDYSSIT